MCQAASFPLHKRDLTAASRRRQAQRQFEFKVSHGIARLHFGNREFSRARDRFGSGRTKDSGGASKDE